MDMQPIYVLDTNILIDYPDIIPNGEASMPNKPTIDLSSAHIIIPTAVIRELSNFKKEKSDRGHTARVVLDRIRKLAESTEGGMNDFYNLKENVAIKRYGQTFSILPVHRNFCKNLPFRPSDNDMDGQIILAALATGLASEGKSIDGTVDSAEINVGNVVLLTNDNGLASRARVRGVKTNRFGYEYPAPYTGRRDLKVPDELFKEYFNTGKIEREMWEQFMPDEQPLIANEFIVMSADHYPKDFDPYDNMFFNIGRYDKQEDTIVRLTHAQNFPCRLKTPGQAIYAEALMNKDFAVVLCTGPAGTGKTFLAAIYSLEACQNGEYIGISVVPCNTEDSVGYLPGDLSEKMDPKVQPIKNAIRNHLIQTNPDVKKRVENAKKFGAKDESKKANKEGGNQKSIKEYVKGLVDLDYQNWFGEPIPIEHARGRDFANEIAIFDEFQDQNHRQADTLIKRLGDDGKVIITGDIEQVHAAYLDRENNGIVYASRLLKDHPMVARVSFTEDEVVRHPLVKEIARRQKENKSST